MEYWNGNEKTVLGRACGLTAALMASADMAEDLRVLAWDGYAAVLSGSLDAV